MLATPGRVASLCALPTSARRDPSFMLDAKTVLLVVLAVVAVGFATFWLRKLREASRSGSVAPTPYMLLVGFVTDFFDTLGIGSFAVTTSFYRARRTIADEHIPGTLNVGHTLPTVAQAFLFTKSVDVDVTTLVVMIAAAVAGSLLGAPIVCRLPRRQIQLGLGVALLVLCTVLVYRQFGIVKAGSTGLTGALLVAGAIGNFVLGALMTIGVGLYAPCLVMVSLLGMNVDTGFPIMMGSCAFLMPLASVPFIRAGSYDARAALGLALAGTPAVVLAVLLVKSLEVYWINWLVAVVIVYTAVNLLRAARATADSSPRA
jgi:uncharacterized membrane protein YfcA